MLEATDDASVGVSFLITPEMADAAARHARTVVASGRPACPLCGRPKDPEGHRCPATNGDLRDADS